MQAGLPFHLMATAYRRKRLMEGLQDREMTAQMASMQDMKETEEKLRQQQQTDDRGMQINYCIQDYFQLLQAILPPV